MLRRPTRLAAVVLSASFAGLALHAEDAKLIFQDDFERNESQEKTDEIGNGWGSNSKKRAGGNKQVDLKDGTMRIYIHKAADHAVSVTHPAEFTDGAVELRFKLEDAKDSIGLNFADLKYKKVHAGHLFVARIYPTQVLLQDLKTGNMDLKIREAKKNKKLTPEQKKTLKTKQKKVKHKTAIGQWHKLRVEARGDTLTVTIDGKPVTSLKSEGIAHPTKRMLRLSVPRNVVVDDVKIYALPAAKKGA
jgi:hypothetical protein